MASKNELQSRNIAKLVGAGKLVAMDTVDFSDPKRPKTCLEVDFPILSINQVASIEGNASKPIYQMSKWWARRRSSVFRSMLIAAATKAPDDPSQTAKLVWDNYYANHQKKKAFANLTVADIFMGGGTTLVEGSRLGMKMSGNDLNPVAWFVVKQELANVDLDDVRLLVSEIEDEVKPQIIPFYYCDGPGGEKGTWTHVPSGRIAPADFDPLTLTPSERKDYSYAGPELTYTFWAKHGPCQVTGCGHRTPIISSSVVAVKTLSVKHWPATCSNCRKRFDVEETDVRMAPDSVFFISPDENPFATLDTHGRVTCPNCGHLQIKKLEKGKNKKVELSLLLLPEWLAGHAGQTGSGEDAKPMGGSAQDDAASTIRWNIARAENCHLLEVRGVLPETIKLPNTKQVIKTGRAGGTVPQKSKYTCANCGTVQDVLKTIKATCKTGPAAGYAVQAFSPRYKNDGSAYNGRFFAEFGADYSAQYNAAIAEWDRRKETDLAEYWPRTEVPFGFMTALNNGDIRVGHGFTHWWMMFNPRQLLVHAQLLKAIVTAGKHSWEVREYVLGGFQQYLRNQNSFCIWNLQGDKMEPMFSNNNFHPKATYVENGVFSKLGRGNWASSIDGIIEGREWAIDPWDTVSVEALRQVDPALAENLSGKGEKVEPHDPVGAAAIFQCSSTDLSHHASGSVDLVITDPPFGGLLHYSELSDFFHVWLRLPMKDIYPEIFGPDLTPKAMEAVANRAREPEDAEGFYKRLLTLCWREAHRILKSHGILSFTFHHSEDDPWVAVLESLFEAGFYLESAYPIRSDETKGEGAKPGTFGSQLIEYDIIHVCRKRTEEPKPVSWARMRREVLQDVRQIEGVLANHAKSGLPAADLQVIRRGKALEYFSRHYGKVLVEDGRPLTVSQALVGINQLIEEESDMAADLPPPNSEPLTRQFLRIFRGKTGVDRDQIQKFLRGTGVSPEAFETNGWTEEKSKHVNLVSSTEFANQWKGRQRKSLTSDYDQAWFLIGACHEGSGINAADQLRNENFKPHPALKPLLDWFSRNGKEAATRQAAIRAGTIYNAWADSNPEIVSKQMEMFA